MGSRIRAKFKCSSARMQEGSRPDPNWKPDPNNPNAHHPWISCLLYTYEFYPVCPSSNDPNHENRTFWSASPSGKVELTCVLTDAFQIGQEYYLDFSLANTPVPA